MACIYLENVRTEKPLIHCITNYVTAGDVANVLLACGASPVMADDPAEVCDIVERCRGLDVNLGTLNDTRLEAMLRAGRYANALKKTVLLDPVGAGASRHRSESACKLLGAVHFDVIRGNISEIRALALGSFSTNGVDASRIDAVREENLPEAADAVRRFSQQNGCVTVATGPIDIVAGGQAAYAIRNGRPEMRSISGVGCMLSGLITAFVSVDPAHALEAACAAVCCIGAAGEIAWERMQEGDGNAAYRNRIIDAVYNMSAELLDKTAKMEQIR